MLHTIVSAWLLLCVPCFVIIAMVLYALPKGRLRAGCGLALFGTVIFVLAPWIVLAMAIVDLRRRAESPVTPPDLPYL